VSTQHKKFLVVPVGDECEVDWLDEADATDEQMWPFLLNRDELFELYKYWTRVQLDEEYFQFVYQQTGTDIRRRIGLALHRGSRIRRLIGVEAEERLFKAVDDELQQKYGRSWTIFNNHTADEARALTEEIYLHIDDRCRCSTVGQHTTDWAWYEREVELHREGLCSVSPIEDSSPARPTTSTGERDVVTDDDFPF
jgi:hypothetical protein